MASSSLDDVPLCKRAIEKIFSSNAWPGMKIQEDNLATELGMSRIPVREVLAKLVGQGILVGGEKGQGVRIRQYNAAEVHNLYSFRAILEGGVAATAATNATVADISRLEMICAQVELEAKDSGFYGSERSADLDHRFHSALAEAAHNKRLESVLKNLLTECHYLFYLYLPREGRLLLCPEEGIAFEQEALRGHRELLKLIRSGNSKDAELKAREEMIKSGLMVNQALTKWELVKKEKGEE